MFQLLNSQNTQHTKSCLCGHCSFVCNIISYWSKTLALDCVAITSLLSISHSDNVTALTHMLHENQFNSICDTIPRRLQPSRIINTLEYVPILVYSTLFEYINSPYEQHNLISCYTAALSPPLIHLAVIKYEAPTLLWDLQSWAVCGENAG